LLNDLYMFVSVFIGRRYRCTLQFKVLEGLISMAWCHLLVNKSAPV